MLRYDLTILGTSDTHASIVNWDYYRDAEYDDAAGNDIGLAKVATLVDQVRAQRQGRATLVLDAGDTIQGTPLATYYATQEPITSTGVRHPVARAMNLISYDAVVLGNHEFNYGLPLLDCWIRQLDCPALAANALEVATGQPAFPPYLMKEVDLGGGAPTLRVGILGLTNPGVAVWDRDRVAGKLVFADLVETARHWVPRLRDDGADLVVVVAHGGDSGRSSYGPDLPNENPSALIAAQVPGIDAVLFGHEHREVPERFVRNTETGAPVLMSEPGAFGQRVTRMDFALSHESGRWQVDGRRSSLLNTNTVEADPRVLAAVHHQHATTVGYVNRVVAHSVSELSARQSRYRCTPIISFVHAVQTRTVARALAGGAHADLPVLSVVAPFRRTAQFPAGPVRIKNVAELYSYDNTLVAVVLTGAQVRTYLEHAARYFRTVAPHAAVDPATISDPTLPDYNFDTLSGVDYDIDISRPIGERIVRLTHAATERAVGPDERFVVAVNNYRRNGGGNFPGVVTEPVYDEQKEIRQLLIEHAQEAGVIDPADFFRPNWRLVRAGEPVF